MENSGLISISFTILDDLENINGSYPCYRMIKYDIESIRCFVDEMLLRYVKYEQIHAQNNIAEELLSKKYYHFSQNSSLYMYAFALEFTRFEIKFDNYHKKIIKWREHDSNDVILE